MCSPRGKRPLESEQPNLLIAVCTLGQVRAEWAIALASALPPVGRKRLVTTLMGFETAHARNVACWLAQDKGCEYLMFWDDDVIPRERAALLRLVSVMDQRSEIAVLGGVYPRRSDVPEPIVVKTKGNGLWWGWADGAVHKVYMTGTGFTLVRVAELAGLDGPVYETDDGRTLHAYFNTRPHLTDDFWLGELCEAAGKGWYVHGDVVCDQIDRESGHLYCVEEAKVTV